MADTLFSRRSFLAASATIVSGAAFGRGDARRRDSVGRAVATTIKLGVASYSLREFSLDKALEMIKALRTPYVNFKSFHLPYEKTPAELAALRGRIENAG